MASSTTIDVDGFGNKDDGMESLDFQDIPHDSPDSPEKGQTTHFTRFPHSAADSDDEADDKDKLIKEEKTGSSSFWTFAYYQQFFDVETAQVGQRIVGSMMPRPGSNYLVHQIRPNPDLYGPFWICTTLVFTTAIAGNLANYFSMAGKAYHWQYDFHKVTFAATAIFSYWWLIPLLLFAVLWWRGSQAKFSFLEMLCVYGYSLAIYVPISILWAIQIPWLQWTLVVVGAVLSGSVLLLTFWPAIKEDSQKIAIGLMVFIFIMHAALAAGFVLYFFHVPASVPAASTVTPKPVPVNKTLSSPKADASAKKGTAAVKDSLNKNQPTRQQPLRNRAAAANDQNGLQNQSSDGGGGAAANPQNGGDIAGSIPIKSRAHAPVVGLGESQPSQTENKGGVRAQTGQGDLPQVNQQSPNVAGEGGTSGGIVQANTNRVRPASNDAQLQQQQAAPQKRRSLRGSKKNRKLESGRA